VPQVALRSLNVRVGAAAPTGLHGGDTRALLGGAERIIATAEARPSDDPIMVELPHSLSSLQEVERFTRRVLSR
jgi:hypothetical protein